MTQRQLHELRRLASGLLTALVAASLAIPTALAGPPYVSDDPEPTDERQFEIYAFGSGMVVREGIGGAAGLDINYGALPDLQLTAVLPVAYDSPSSGATVAGFGDMELAAKYRIVRQAALGWDIAVFPRVILPSGSRRVGERHASFLLPLWLEKDFGDWSTFGGGGCEINRGGGSKDFCLLGWALTRQVLPELQLGAEIFHQSAATKSGRPTTGIGAGLRYDVSANYHLLAYGGSGIQNARQSNELSWYAAVLFAF